MNELFGKPPALRGRKQNVSARAWISRKSNTEAFKSHVSLGDWVTHTLSSRSRIRAAALEFNRCHLFKRLRDSVSVQDHAAR